jgi:hypothetical protein
MQHVTWTVADTWMQRCITSWASAFSESGKGLQPIGPTAALDTLLALAFQHRELNPAVARRDDAAETAGAQVWGLDLDFGNAGKF